MSSKKADQRPEARLPKGMRDIEAPEIRAMERMLGTIRRVYESYGFEPLDTPAFEYTDALGKFLPDQDRPNEGVFSFQDEDEQWLSLRYDLTAPLARYVAQNYDGLPKPFRRYQTGPVWRNEKPGPGRFRQFTQFDADTVGTDNVAADAELCMLAADTMEALGIKTGDYCIRVNNRKVIDGLLDEIGLADDTSRRFAVLRAIDKYDRLGVDGVKLLLGDGRKDESGDFTKGASLAPAQIKRILSYTTAALLTKGVTIVGEPSEKGENPANYLRAGKLANDPDEKQYWMPVSNEATLSNLQTIVGQNDLALEGIAELQGIARLTQSANYGDGQILIDPSVVRGLEYYTGPVYEAELTFEARTSDGALMRFGSVGGGGRYDGLVSRFKGTKIPATGFSIGVSRLYSALRALGKLETEIAPGPVVILAMDKARLGDYNRMARLLRDAPLNLADPKGPRIRAEVYLGTSGMKAQMKYADRRLSLCVIIQGSDELARGEVTIKDLIEGDRQSANIADHQAWREGRPAQVSVKLDKMVEEVRRILTGMPRRQDSS